MFEDEISPEELFNRFFGGGGMGGGGMGGGPFGRFSKWRGETGNLLTPEQAVEAVCSKMLRSLYST